MDKPTLIVAKDPRGVGSVETKWLEAARGGLLDALKQLLASDASMLAVRDRFGNALHWAASRDHARAVKWLLEAGMPVDGRDTSKAHTPLHIAAFLGHAEPLRLLLAAGADVDGLTPALAAALYGHADTVKRILRYQVAERREDLEAKERQKLEVRF